MSRRHLRPRPMLLPPMLLHICRSPSVTPFQRTARWFLTTLGPHFNASGLNPDPSTLTTLNTTLALASSPPPGSWLSWIPQGTNPPLSRHSADHQQAHRPPNKDALPHFPCWFAWISFCHNLPRCRQKGASQCFNLSKQYFQRDCWVENYVKMIIQVITPVAGIKDQTNWKVY